MDIKKKVGDTIVDGTIESAKEKISDVWEDIKPDVIEAGICLLCFKAIWTFLSTRPTKTHFYIHIV